MKILIRTKQGGGHLLVKITGEETIKQVLYHINKGAYLNAIDIITEKGNILEKVRETDLPLIEANLIITEKQAHFDLLAG